MRIRIPSIALAIVASACSHSAGSQSPATVAAAPVRSLEVRFVDHLRNGMLADHAVGTAYVFDDAVKVVLRSGVFPFVPTPNIRLVSLSAALATGDTAGRWDTTRESPKVFVRELNTRADTLADSVTFWIRNTRNVDLSKHWGFFGLCAWPLLLPLYAFRTRGSGGWRLIAQVFAAMLAPQFGRTAGALCAALLGVRR